MTNHRSLYTDFVIDRCWGHLMSQFQVKWATGISSSFFKEKIARKDFSLIYKRKKAKRKNSLPPSVYRDQPKNKVGERES